VDGTSPNPTVTQLFRGGLDVLVTSSAWPSAPVNIPLALPVALSGVTSIFEAFYKSVNKEPRKLTWLSLEGSAVVGATFVSHPGAKWVGDLIVSPMQMCILLLFNTMPSLSFRDIVLHLKMDGITEYGRFRREVAAALVSLTASRHPLLLCDKNSRIDHPCMSSTWIDVSFDDDATFIVNSGFHPHERLIQVHRVMTSSEDDMSAQDRASLLAYRESVIDSVALQQLKALGGTSSEETLTRAVIGSLSRRFQPSPTTVLARIRRLIGQGILGRTFQSKTSVCDSVVVEVHLSGYSSVSFGAEESKGNADEVESKDSQDGITVADVALALPRASPPKLKRLYSDDVMSSGSGVHAMAMPAIVTGDTIADRLADVAVAVADVCGVSRSEGELLCFTVNWDAEEAIQSYLTNPHGFRDSAGLPVSGPSVFRSRTGTDTVMCDVCMDEVEAKDILEPWCGHGFCRTCWSTHVTGCVAEGSVPPRCMFHGCSARLSSYDVFDITSDEAPVKLCRRKYAETHMLTSSSMGSCKNPQGCDGVLMMGSGVESSCVTCSKCRQSFCVRCELPPHAPAGCAIMKTWHERGGFVEMSTEDMAALETVLKTTKPCPKCGVRIEKNQGCECVV
jgi:Cullin family